MKTLGEVVRTRFTEADGHVIVFYTDEKTTARYILMLQQQLQELRGT